GVRIVRDASQSGWRVASPGSAQVAALEAPRHRELKLGVIGSNSAVLDDQICLCRTRQHCGQLCWRGVDNAFNITVIARIALLLSSINVRFGEGDVVSQASQVAVKPTVVGRRSVPV